MKGDAMHDDSLKTLIHRWVQGESQPLFSGTDLPPPSPPTGKSNAVLIPEFDLSDPDDFIEGLLDEQAPLAPSLAEQHHDQVGPTGRPVQIFPAPDPRRHTRPAATIVVSNHKGGVGRSTTALNLAASLAHYGQKVLAVDIDPQGALTAGLGIDTNILESPTIDDLMIDRDTTFEATRIVTGIPQLDLLPSDKDLAASAKLLTGFVAPQKTLKVCIELIRDQYDYIIIDSSSPLDMLTVNALTAAQFVVIPMNCQYFSLRGVSLTLDTINDIREKLNPDLELAGILPTMYNIASRHDREVLGTLLEGKADMTFHTVIGETKACAEASAAGDPLLIHAPHANATEAYLQFSRELHALLHSHN